MKQRKLLHRRILAMFVTFMMTFMSVPAGVFAEELSDREAVDAAIAAVNAVNFTPDETVVSVDTAEDFIRSIINGWTIDDTYNVNIMWNGYGTDIEPTENQDGSVSFRFTVVRRDVTPLVQGTTNIFTITIPSINTQNQGAVTAYVAAAKAALQAYTWTVSESDLSEPSSYGVEVYIAGVAEGLISSYSEFVEISVTPGEYDNPPRDSETPGSIGFTIYINPTAGAVDENYDQFGSSLEITAAPALTDAEAVAADTAALTWDTIKNANTNQTAVTGNLTLPTTGANGSTITWTSSDTAVIANDGTVTRPTYANGDEDITLNAAITKGGASDAIELEITVSKAARSTDATLSNLQLVQATAFSPTFDPAVEDYTATVPYENTFVTVNLSRNDEYANVNVSGNTSLNVGENTVTVTVTAEDGTTSKTYTIIVTREQYAYTEGLVLKSDGLYYNDEILTASDSKLGGGSYSFIDGVLTLTNVNFTTTAQTAFELRERDVNLVLNGTNSFTSTYNSDYYTRGIDAIGTLTVSGDGSLSVESGDSTLNGYNNGLRIQAGTLVINSGTVTITAGTSVSGTVYGVYGSVIVNGGDLTVTGSTQAIQSGTGTINMPAYSWNDGSSSGTYPSSALTINNQTYIAITALTGVSPTTAAFNKATPANIELTYSIVTGDTLDSITISDDTLTSSEYTIEDNIITILSTYLNDLDNDTYTLTLNTSDDVNPEVALTIANVYQYGLVLQSYGLEIDGLYYDGDKITESVASDILGGGMYSYNETTSELLLSGVNFTTLAGTALSLGAQTSLNIVGSNSFTSTATSGTSIGIYANFGILVNGSGSLTVRSGNAASAALGLQSGGNIRIDGPSVTAIAGTSSLGSSYGINVTGNFFLDSGSITASGGNGAFNKSPTLPVAYKYKSSSDGALTTSATPLTVFGDYVYIETVTAATPATYSFNKAVSSATLFEITYSLAPGVTFNNIVKNGTTPLTPTYDYVIDGNTIEITSIYLMSLAPNTYTITLDTSAATDPTVTLTVTNEYEKGLVLKSTGLQLGDDGSPLTQNAALDVLGGGKYTFAGNVLNLNGVNFTTSAEKGLDLSEAADVKVNLSGDNFIASTASATESIGVFSTYSFTIEGTGTLTARSSNTTNMISSGISSVEGGITINGGTLEAIGGNSTAGYGFSAGIAAYDIKITAGSVTAKAGTATNSRGIEAGSYKITIIGGTVTAEGEENAFYGTLELPVAYKFTTTKGGGLTDSGTTALSSIGTYAYIESMTAVTPVTATFNKQIPANIELTYSLAPGTSIQSITNGDYTLTASGLASSDYHVTGNSITIMSEYLEDLANASYTFKINTSGDVDPEVTITVTKIYDKPLLLKTVGSATGLYYDDEYLAANDEKLGGGSYTWDVDSSTLTLNGVNFATSSLLALEIYIMDVTISLSGTNTFATTAFSGHSAAIYSHGNLTVSGTGSLTAAAAYTSDTSKGIQVDNSLRINGGQFTAIGEDFGIYAHDLSIRGGEVTIIGKNTSILLDSLSLPAAYEWEEDDKEGEYPFDEFVYDGGERVYIKAVPLTTKIVSTGLTFDKVTPVDVAILYTLAAGVSLENVQLDGENIAYTDGPTSIIILKEALSALDLSLGSHTIKFLTDSAVDPEVTLTVTAVYPLGLVFNSSLSRLEYNAKAASPTVLGGGSYSYENGILTLTNVNFTTSDDYALILPDNITLNIAGTNRLKTLSTSIIPAAIFGEYTNITGTGSLIAEATTGSAFMMISMTVSMTNYTWEAINHELTRTSGTNNYTYDFNHRKVTITYKKPAPPPPPPETEATTTTTAEETTTVTEETTTATPEETTTTAETTTAETTTTTAETTTTTAETTTTPAETTTATTTATPSYPSYPSGGGGSRLPQTPPKEDTAPPPEINNDTDDEESEEPTEEDNKKLKVNGKQKTIAVNSIDEDSAEISINGKEIETASITAAEYIEDGDAAEMFYTTANAVSVVTKDGDVIAGANKQGTLNSASTSAAIKAAAVDEIVAEVTVITGNEIEAISKGAMQKIATAAAEAGVSVNLQKDQYKPDSNELIYRITIDAVLNEAIDVNLSAEFDGAVVEASKQAFERTFGIEGLGAFSLNQRETFGQRARIQVKASAIGFKAEPGDIVYVAIFNPETGEYIQVEGIMGESGFITFETELSGVVVISNTSFK